MSVFKDFRSTGPDVTRLNTLSKRFDEPSYISFALQFAPNQDFNYNNAKSNAFFDNMPHPLFMQRDAYIPIEQRTNYATIDYLYDATEVTRVAMLKDFIRLFNSLQNDFQWYFQKIEGVADLLKVNPKKGIRVPQEKRLTITCLEAIDLRMSYLLNLYHKIAYDDVYQRWVLNDMMRYFSLDIYLSEFRVFQNSSLFDSLGNPTGVPLSFNPQTPSQADLVLQIMSDTIPTWKIHCEMCEFDIEDINFNHLSSLNVGADP